MVPVQRPAAAHPSVARIFVTTRSGRNIGSGTVIDGGGVLTCAHLFEGDGAIAVIFSDGSSHRGTLVAIDRVWELALLRIAQPRQGVKIGTTAPKVGDRVRSCGYGRNGRYWCNQGRVMGYVMPEGAGVGRYETLEISGTARQGDSGGPIFNDRNELVAVLWGTNNRIVGGTYCGRIRKFLQSIINTPQITPSPTPPIVPPPITTAIQSQIDALRAEIAAMKMLSMIPGPRGPAGATGAQGNTGQPGPSGQIDPKTLPPITVQTVKDGKIIQSEQVYLGGVLSLRLVPVTSGGSE